ncbi:MAG: hypothetical protein U1E23_11570 [Reyranellaceae bacterium]
MKEFDRLGRRCLDGVMWGLVQIYLLLLGALIAWEVAVQVWRRLRPRAPLEAPADRQHFSPEQERRRRLEALGRRWPAPARWG